MKKRNSIFSFLLIGFSAFVFQACDEVKHPYIPTVSTELNQTLYPGDWSSYPWPVFTANANTNRNILLEDYTGHQCAFCPGAATTATNIESANPGRVFVVGIHTSPGGPGPFQQLEDTGYVHDFTNPVVNTYGATFGSGYGFDGNPKGTVSRKVFNGTMFQAPNSWTSAVQQAITENDLQTNIQAVVNYFPSTRGVFLHAEVDTMDLAASNVAVVVHVVENSFISKQKFPGGASEHSYHHHNVHRANIDAQPFGRSLTKDDLNSNGKFYLNYSYKLPAQYDAANCHLLVYTMNKTTYEILHVVKVDIE